jgi:DNA repair exonuclease SbcCD ATPase subunit
MATPTGDSAPLAAATTRLLRALRVVEERRGRAEELRQTAARLLGTSEQSRVEAVLAFQAEMLATLAEALAEVQAAAARPAPGDAGPPALPQLAALAEEIVALEERVAALEAGREPDGE